MITSAISGVVAGRTCAVSVIFAIGTGTVHCVAVGAWTGVGTVDSLANWFRTLSPHTTLVARTVERVFHLSLVVRAESPFAREITARVTRIPLRFETRTIIKGYTHI